MIRLGLCCTFKEEKIKFFTTTVTYCLSLKEKGKNPHDHISQLILKNSQSLLSALKYCYEKRIGCFRINSRFFPMYSYPELLYEIEELKDGQEIIKNLELCRLFAKENDIRLTLHPDQFVILNSPQLKIVENSVRELEYHRIVADFVGADVINIHLGGVYGNKPEALKRFAVHFKDLSLATRRLITLENDDKSYTPEDLLPFCEKLGIPFVYDVHHHRCLKDSLSEDTVTQRALSTWNREPLFHLSSPLHGWEGKTPAMHHDYIDVEDFPIIWSHFDLTIEVEAKAKEVAVLKLREELQRRRVALWHITEK